jgi:DNA-binding PadR family transcriptional regulator
VKEADFNFLKEKTEATSGNLSVQISKLEQAGYLEVRKQFKGKMPQTLCRITPQGIYAFENYVKHIQKYLNL